MIPADARFMIEQRRATLATHENGFIIVPIGPRLRINVWPDVPIARQKTKHHIHDHRFAFESEILCGSLENVVYDVRFMVRGAYACHVERDGKLESFRNNECDVSAQTRMTYHRGQDYTLDARIFHDSIPYGLTATLMHKTAVYDGILCRVLVPFGVEPDNDFNREDANSQDVLYAIVDRAIALADRT